MTDVVSGILGGPELSLSTRALIGLLVCSGLVIALARKRVVQIPTLQIAGLGILLPLVIGGSILLSAFPYTSYSAWLTWVVYAVCLFAAVGTLGRRVGVKSLLWALTAGGTAVALKAVQEYAGVRAIEPGHRVFGDWNNPNALAGVLAILIPLSLGLCVSTDRLESLGAGLCGSLMLFGLVLTQSKGGVLVTGIAILTVAVAAVAWKGKLQTLRIVGPVALALLLTFASIQSNRSQGGGSPIGRIVAAGSSQDQSAGFRSLLWKGTAELVKARPQGWGIGTYRYESARPGLTEQTFHSHQTWLQLAAEGGVISLLTLIALTLVWLKVFLSAARKWPWPEAGWRAGILGACVAGAANGFVESNLIYLGTGVVLFLILGAGLQLSSDGSLPEVAPKRFRFVVAMIVGIVPLLLVHAALVEIYKSSALAAASRMDLAVAQESLAMARNLAAADGEAQYLSASMAARAPEDQIAWLERAVALSPNTKYLRAYARAAQRQGKTLEAIAALNRALQRDPKNLAALDQKYKFLDEDTNLPEALKVAQQLVDVESTPYFAIRAIPELVPLETYNARTYLAAHTTDRKRKADLLIGALRGFVSYLEKTAPMVKRLTGGDPTKNFLGHDRKEAEEVLKSGQMAANELKLLYGESGDQAGVSEVSSLSSGLKLD